LEHTLVKLGFLGKILHGLGTFFWERIFFYITLADFGRLFFRTWCFFPVGRKDAKHILRALGGFVCVGPGTLKGLCWARAFIFRGGFSRACPVLKEIVFRPELRVYILGGFLFSSRLLSLL